MKRILVLLLSLIFLVFISSRAVALEILEIGDQPLKFSVGFEISSPLSVGLSGLYNISDTWAVQGIIGTPQTGLSMSGIKVLYRFFENKALNVYLYGLKGNFAESKKAFETPETVTGTSLGVGIEFSPYSTSDFKNSVEWGYAKIPFSDFNYSYMFSYGVRFYF